MTACWAQEPEERPTFDEIVSQLKNCFVTDTAADFEQVRLHSEQPPNRPSDEPLDRKIPTEKMARMQSRVIKIPIQITPPPLTGSESQLTFESKSGSSSYDSQNFEKAVAGNLEAEASGTNSSISSSSSSRSRSPSPNSMK